MKQLPVLGSSASSTAFVHARVDGPGGLHLFMDGNGKITAGNGTLAEPRPNAFSLRNVEDCPQATNTCKAVCYVENLRGAQPDLYALYEHNALTIREILADREFADAWVMHVARWILRNAAGGFRWHVSGDVFSLEYARWIADVCRESYEVDHWIYTRSFDFIDPLAEVSTAMGGNLALNLSCDQDNFEKAARVSALSGGLRLCYLTVDGTLPRNYDQTALCKDDIIFMDYSLRPRQCSTLAESPWWNSLSPDEKRLVCPVDAHGKAENRRCGPCNKCLT